MCGLDNDRLVHSRITSEETATVLHWTNVDLSLFSGKLRDPASVQLYDVDSVRDTEDSPLYSVRAWSDRDGGFRHHKAVNRWNAVKTSLSRSPCFGSANTLVIV